MCSDSHPASNIGTAGSWPNRPATPVPARCSGCTAGEGGTVVTHDANLAACVASLRDHGRPPHSPHGHHELGWNLRLSEFLSALLRVQLGRLD
ncbi:MULTISPECIES: DegT/DnrJ/EryC1/StrS family aminotransferase [unclassified Streptomyces]|uniref:DegT/DnrJ/EryC1/StrS family aminotransferase n=1 Tax=unclassified Streptomyces TaxID=2593676 RepID=UPI003245D7F7